MHLSVILCTVLVAAVAAQYTEEDDVLVLTKANFQQAVSEFKHLLVEFCKCIGILHSIWFMRPHVVT